MTWIILRNKTQSLHCCCSSSSYGLHQRLQRPITVSTPTKAWLNPDETIGIDPTKDCVCLIQSVIAETFRSVHDTLNVSNKQATRKCHSSVPEVCGTQRPDRKKKSEVCSDLNLHSQRILAPLQTSRIKQMFVCLLVLLVSAGKQQHME